MNKTTFTMNNQDQRGVASILTVILFILIVSVITLGFMRMASLESEQTLEDSLSKSALAAAYSGVSDGKRALLYCLKNPTDLPLCDDTITTPGSIYNQTCRGFFDGATNTVPSKLGIVLDSQGAVPVGDTAANERYTCVIISKDTWDVSGPLVVDTLRGTDMVPLRGVSAFTSVRISWNKSSASVDMNNPRLDYNGQALIANYRAPDAYDHSVLGPIFEYQLSWPSVLRTSLFAHPNNYLTYDDVTGASNISERTSFLYPRSGGGGPSDTRSLASLTTRQSVNCRSGANGHAVNPNSNLGTYSCQLTISNLPDSTANTMYLQLTNLYNDTDYVVELLDAAGQPVKFDDVSPMIDSTGAVENVFRRVQVRLRYQGFGVGGSTPILPNALDVGTGICKNFGVSASTGNFRENCGF